MGCFTTSEIPTLPIGSLPIWCLASRSPDCYQILPIYYKILKTRGKLLIFRIFGDLSLWNTHIILTFFAKSIMVCYNSGRNDVKIQDGTWENLNLQNFPGACPLTPLEARAFGTNYYSLFSITWGWNLCNSKLFTLHPHRLEVLYSNFYWQMVPPSHITWFRTYAPL